MQIFEPMGKHMLRNEIANGLYVGSIDVFKTATSDQMSALYDLTSLLTELLYREGL